MFTFGAFHPVVSTESYSTSQLLDHSYRTLDHQVGTHFTNSLHWIYCCNRLDTKCSPVSNDTRGAVFSYVSATKNDTCFRLYGSARNTSFSFPEIRRVRRIVSGDIRGRSVRNEWTIGYCPLLRLSLTESHPRALSVRWTPVQVTFSK